MCAHGLAVAVLDAHLALSVRTQVRQQTRAAGFRESLPDAMRGVNRERHVLLRLVAGEAEHHALVARALLVARRRRYALADVRRLALDRGDDRAAVAVEAALGRGVADVADHVLRDLAELGLGLAGDLAGDHDEPGLDERLARDTTVGIARQQRVQDGVGDLVADLVRVALVHGLGGEDVVLQHRAPLYPMRVAASKLKARPETSRVADRSERAT